MEDILNVKPRPATEHEASLNTDREIWRSVPGDYYSPSIHVTKEGAIGINVGGRVFVKDVRDWHSLAEILCENS